MESQHKGPAMQKVCLYNDHIEAPWAIIIDGDGLMVLGHNVWRNIVSDVKE